MTDQTNPPKDDEFDQPVIITDMDTFIRAICHWQDNRLGRLRHYFSIPDGTDVEVTDDEGTRTITLTGDVLDAFKAGLQTALHEVEELPFTGVFRDESEKPDASSLN